MNTAYLCKDVNFSLIFFVYFLIVFSVIKKKKSFNFDQNYRGKVKNFETNKISIALFIYLGR